MELSRTVSGFVLRATTKLMYDVLKTMVSVEHVSNAKFSGCVLDVLWYVSIQIGVGWPFKGSTTLVYGSWR